MEGNRDEAQTIEAAKGIFVCCVAVRGRQKNIRKTLGSITTATRKLEEMLAGMCLLSSLPPSKYRFAYP